MIKVHIPQFSLPDFEKVPLRGQSKDRKSWEKEILKTLHKELVKQAEDYFNIETKIDERIGLGVFGAKYFIEGIKTDLFAHFYPINGELEEGKPIDLELILEKPTFQDQDYRIKTTTTFSPEEGPKFFIEGRGNDQSYQRTMLQLMKTLFQPEEEEGYSLRFSTSGVPRLRFQGQDMRSAQIVNVAEAYVQFLDWANESGVMKKVTLNLDLAQKTNDVIDLYHADDGNYPGLENAREEIKRTRVTTDTYIKDALCKAEPVRKLYEALQKQE
jgi:hypothetical protein